MIIQTISSALRFLSTTRLKGLDLYLNFPDRIILEDTIIPYFTSNKEFSRILFVGCGWYNKPYRKLFKNNEYWTIEIDESRKKYGSINHHIVDKLENLTTHVDENYFDAIIYTGVFGWGVNSLDDTEKSFEQCFRCLRQGGILVFGWDDVAEHRPFSVFDECQNIKKFSSFFFPPLSTCQYLVADDEFRHTFNFFIKS